MIANATLSSESARPEKAESVRAAATSARPQMTDAAGPFANRRHWSLRAAYAATMPPRNDAVIQRLSGDKAHGDPANMTARPSAIHGHG
jgi:hypothetical protein